MRGTKCESRREGVNIYHPHTWNLAHLCQQELHPLQTLYDIGAQGIGGRLQPPPPFPSIKTDTALFQAEDMLQHYIFSSQYQPIPFLYWYLGNRHAAWLTIGHRAPQISVGSSWWGKIVELVFKILTWCTIFMKERRINIEYVISAFQVNISDTNTGLKSGISADTTIKNR